VAVVVLRRMCRAWLLRLGRYRDTDDVDADVDDAYNDDDDDDDEGGGAIMSKSSR